MQVALVCQANLHWTGECYSVCCCSGYENPLEWDGKAVKLKKEVLKQEN